LRSRCQPRTTAPPVSARPSPASGTGYNVVLITIDTLRADHLGMYGYRRATSPRLDAFATRSAVFDAAYTYWPKTRASMIMLMTGRRPSQNGYSKTHAVLLDFNATLASVLKAAGYSTTAYVDNANVASELGYARASTRTWRPGSGPSSRARWTAPSRSRKAVWPRSQRAAGQAVLPLAALREPARSLHAAGPVRHDVPRRVVARRRGPCGW
jgi:arylsulfatase A-like enzyme